MELIAKLEAYDCLGNMDAIIEASDGIMVARGDLGAQVGCVCACVRVCVCVCVCACVCVCVGRGGCLSSPLPARARRLGLWPPPTHHHPPFAAGARGGRALHPEIRGHARAAGAASGEAGAKQDDVVDADFKEVK